MSYRGNQNLGRAETKKRGHFSSSHGVGVGVGRLCGNLLGRPKSIPMTLDGKLDRSAA